jgi:hypothetical protein
MAWLSQLLSSIAVAFGLGSFFNNPDCPPPAPAPAITIEELGVLLEEYCYLPEAQHDPDGNVIGFKVDIFSGDKTVPVYFQLSPDRKTITVTAELVPVDDVDGVSSGLLAALLQRNNLNNSPFVLGMNEHFVVTLQLSKPLSEMTEAAVFDLIDQLTETIDESPDLWALAAVAPDWIPDGPLV